MLQSATGEQAVHSQDGSAASSMRLEEFGKGLTIQARNANHRLQTADGQNHQGKQNSRLEFRNLEAVAERVGNGSKHGGLKSETGNPKTGTRPMFEIQDSEGGGRGSGH